MICERRYTTQIRDVGLKFRASSYHGISLVETVSADQMYAPLALRRADHSGLGRRENSGVFQRLVCKRHLYKNILFLQK